MTGVCAFTGHRRLGADFSEERLKKAIEEVLKKGCDKFYCGMAMGFDLEACKTLISFRDRYSFTVSACIPCSDQPSGYSKKEKILYDEMCAACDEKIVLYDSYVKGCMHERNRYMVDRCDFLIAYFNGKTGGTAYTVNYAAQRGKEIIYI